MEFVQMFENKIKAEVEGFRKKVDQINKSENPYYQDAAVRDYEIKQHREKMEAAVEEIKANYKAEAETKLTDAKKAAAESSFYVSDASKKLVDDKIDNFLADVQLVMNDEAKLAIYKELEQSFDYMDEPKLAYLRKQLPKLVQGAGENKALLSKIRGLNTILRGLETPEQAKASEIEQAVTSTTVDAPLRRMKLTHSAYSDYENNQHSRRNRDFV